MTEITSGVYTTKAIKAIHALNEIGFKTSSNPGMGKNRILMDDLRGVKPRKETMAIIIRNVRELTNLEKTGVVIPDVDRMGRFCGWHMKEKD